MRNCSYCGMPFGSYEAVIQLRLTLPDPAKPGHYLTLGTSFLCPPTVRQIRLQEESPCVVGFKAGMGSAGIGLVPINPGDDDWEETGE